MVKVDWLAVLHLRCWDSGRAGEIELLDMVCSPCLQPSELLLSFFFLVDKSVRNLSPGLGEILKIQHFAHLKQIHFSNIFVI